LATILGCSVAAAVMKKQAFFKALPALAKLLKKIKKRFELRGYLVGLDGRRLHIRSDHAALNTLLQSAGAIQMKRALVILDNNLQFLGYVPGKDYEFVANVHDEWQIETNAGTTIVGEEATDAIKLAGDYYGFKCPLKGNYEVGDNWADTH
jgi:DNA polymerase-1